VFYFVRPGEQTQDNVKEIAAMPCSFKGDESLSPPRDIENYDYTCRFVVADRDLITFEGKQWCKFHLPMEGKDGSKSEKADWDREQIEKFNFDFNSRLTQLNSRSSEPLFDATGVVFPAEITITERRVAKMFRFAEAQFLGGLQFHADQGITEEISFERASFKGNIDFTYSQFRSHTNFRHAKFYKQNEGDSPSFSSCKFRAADTIFENAEFHNGARFVAAEFATRAQFEKAKFWGEAKFSRSTFIGDACFEKATFKDGRAMFDGTVFSARLIANNAEFIKVDVDFSDGMSDKPFQYVNFESSMFDGELNFNNRKFASTTIFKGCTFHKAPKFFGSVLHEDTTFPPEKNFLDRKSADAGRCYRKLKQDMEQFRARQEEAMFYALEQESMRASSNMPRIVKGFSWLYDKSARYGLSLGRPLIWIGAVFITSWIFYASVATQTWCIFRSLDRALVSKAYLFTVEQLVRPFSAWRMEAVPEWSKGPLWALQLGSTAQALLSLAFFSLFLLALRWRFKRG